MVSVSNESALRKKLQEIHDYDCVTFDVESVLSFTDRIIKLVKFGTDHNTQNGLSNHGNGVVDVDSTSIPESLRSLLLKISCVFTCKCSGGDSDTSTMEILKLLSNYEWEAKIAIVVASFVVEFAQFTHVVTFYKNNPLGGLVAILKQISIDVNDDFDEMRSTFTTIVQEMIEVTKFIAEFRALSLSKYISSDVETLQVALIQIPISVYSMIRVIVACASKLTGILGQSEISPYAETWNIRSFEQQIITIRTSFKTRYTLCESYIEEKKIISYIVKLKLKFDKTAVYSNNQKILQLIFNCKDGLLTLEFGTKEVGVEVLKGNTVLLFITGLDISDDDFFILNKFYYESRKKKEFKYEIVWFPIVEIDQENETKFKEMKMKMPWYMLKHPSLLKPGMARFVREEWRYSNKAILVALDPRGKVANPNALHMVSTWGNTAYPFTHSRDFDIWSCYKEWSLTLLIHGNDRKIPQWIKEDKIICLYGGNDCDWIRDFVTQARKIEEYAGIKLEMMYTGTNTSTELSDIITSRSHAWEADSARYFWKRIDSMVQTETHHGNKVTMTKESILVEVRNIHSVAQGGKEWALISHGAGSGSDKMAWGGGEVILEALVEFEAWRAEVKFKGFVAALNGYLAGIKPEVHVCMGCHRPI